MARIIAIDYGKKRVGVAVTDALKIAANGLDTVATSDIFNFLEKYVEKEYVEKIIVGKATQMNGEDSESMKGINVFFATLTKKFPKISIEYADERFTSVLAHRTMLEAGLKKKDRQNKSLVDKISATIILQSYLNNVLMC
jgi:putative Holliday junction resolvase